MKKMSRKALFGIALALSTVLLSSLIIASLNVMSWQFPFMGSTATINNGASISFDVAVASFNPGAMYTVDLYDNNYNLIRNLRTGTTDSTSLYSETLTITAADYNNAAGTYYVVTYSTEGSGTSLAEDVDTLTLIVSSTAPVLSNLPDVTMTSGTSVTAFDLDSYVTDANDPDSTLTWVVLGNNTNVSVSINPSNFVTITAAATFNGTQVLTFVVTDPSGAAAADNVTVTVNPPSTTTTGTSSSNAKEEAALKMVTVQEAEGNFILIRNNGALLEDFELNVYIETGSDIIKRTFRTDFRGNAVMYEDLNVNLESEGIEPGTYLAKIRASSDEAEDEEEGYLLLDLE